MKKLLALSLLVLVFAITAREHDVFSKDNLVAWCVVPFDARERGPEERAAMLQSLGITKLAYDWREKHIPTFDAELDALNKYGIRLQAFWIASGLEPATSKPLQTILAFLRRRQVKTELWYLLNPGPQFSALSQEEKLDKASAAVRYVASEADKVGSKVGIYNHGGWFGEPENQLAILRRLKMPNVGIVYNFHHGHEQMDRFPQFLTQLVPHLYAININGMRAGAAKILPLGQGDRELEMLRVIRNSRYRGPIGILNHIETQDAEVGLRSNIEGLKSLLRQMGEARALATY